MKTTTVSITKIRPSTLWFLRRIVQLLGAKLVVCERKKKPAPPESA